jgi:hypothetical protein
MIAFRHPRALHVVILWRSLPLARQDYRASQSHRLCLQVTALMQWAYCPEAIRIATMTMTMMVTTMGVTTMGVAITIVSDEERLF